MCLFYILLEFAVILMFIIVIKIYVGMYECVCLIELKDKLTASVKRLNLEQQL